MTREATERSVANRTAHAIRAAAVRLARERACQDPDPSQVYGCVDWFRYDVSSAPPQEDTAPPPGVPRSGPARGGVSSTH